LKNNSDNDLKGKGILQQFEGKNEKHSAYFALLGNNIKIDSTNRDKRRFTYESN